MGEKEIHFEVGECLISTPNHSIFSSISVRPSKPLIRAMPNSGSKGRIVQGYLGPFQIGTRLTLLCQVIGGE